MLARLASNIAQKPNWSQEDTRRYESYTAEIREINAAMAAEARKNGFSLNKDAEELNQRHYKAFMEWLRAPNKVDLSGESYRTLQEVRSTLGVEGTTLPGAYFGSGGAFFAPIGFVSKVNSALKLATPFFDEGFATIAETATGAALNWPTDNDTTNSGILTTENEQTQLQDIPTGLVSLGAYRFSSKGIAVSNEAVADIAVKPSLDDYLAKRFGVRIGRGANPYLTTGTGTAQPTGCLYGLTATRTATGSADTDGVGDYLIGYYDVCTLIDSLDPLYRSNGTFMMHPATLTYLQQVTGRNGQPVFTGLNLPEPHLLGYKLKLNPSMPQVPSEASSPAANYQVLAFADFSYFIVRRAMPLVTKSVERLVEYGQTLFSHILRIDSQWVDGASGANACMTLQVTY